jgi:thiamine biosynthesis lipoprotein ApbE
VLCACERWRTRSGGAFNAQAAQIIDAWRQAEKTGHPPSESTLFALTQQIDGRAWEVQPGSTTAKRLGQGRVTVDALAKGYIVDKTVAAARKHASGVTGIMLDVGGDIVTWGTASAAADRAPWQIAVADPRHPQDTAPPLVTVRMSAGAIATSGNYARYFQVGARRYSHIVDPRTGQPADHVISATAIAADCCTADALATILCVLRPQQSLDLIRSLRNEGIKAECFIVDREGKQWSSPGWQALVEPETKPILAMDAGGWQNELLITLSIMNPGGRKIHRPIVAIWIEDAGGKAVRTLSVWGNETKYLKELSSWWSFARGNQKLVRAVTRASRAPGRYELVWDGKDDRGQVLPQGTYTVRVESAREKGRHVNMKGKIACGEKAETAKIEGNSEIGEITLSYGPREKKP